MTKPTDNASPPKGDGEPLPPRPNAHKLWDAYGESWKAVELGEFNAYADVMEAELRSSRERLELREVHDRASLDWERRTCEKALVALAGANICTPAETYGTNTSWAVDDLCKALTAMRERLEKAKNALEKIIEMNRQHAHDQYGDADKAESWSCVVVAREALKAFQGER